MNKLIPAVIHYTADGVPFSTQFDDVYHSSAGAIGQAEHVFLQGNDLPQRWQNKETFTILETGFGLGLNFLATWKAFRLDTKRCNRLHFISVEKHPFNATALRELHRQWPELATLSDLLVDQWPSLIPGFHRLHFENDCITLTLLFGDALELLPLLQANVDAFFLDGFSPQKNPALWSLPLFQTLSRLANDSASFATYTVASGVRNALMASGATFEKKEGFGQKRDMLVGKWHNKAEKPFLNNSNRKAIVIGAGLAGSHCAERLAVLGWTVNVIEQHATLANEASGNASGVLYPILHMGNTLNARFSHIAFLYAVQHIRKLNRLASFKIPMYEGLLHLPSRTDWQRLKAIIEHHGFQEDFVRLVDTEEACELAANKIAGPGCWFAKGAWIDPPALCRANLESSSHIHLSLNTQVTNLQKLENGEWGIYSKHNQLVDSAPVIILANAMGVIEFQQTNYLPLHSVRGQVTYLSEPNEKLKISVTGHGYIAPMASGGYCVGSTFQHNDDDALLRHTDHLENLNRLHAMLPDFTSDSYSDNLHGRVAWRVTTPDRLPIYGDAEEGLYVATGLGARGIMWAPLGAELIAAQITGEPLPFDQELTAAINPKRFNLSEN